MNKQQQSARDAAIQTAYAFYVKGKGDAQRSEDFRAGWDAGYNYDPPADPEFDALLAAAIENVNDRYRKEGYDAAKGESVTVKAEPLVSEIVAILNNDNIHAFHKLLAIENLFGIDHEKGKHKAQQPDPATPESTATWKGVDADEFLDELRREDGDIEYINQLESTDADKGVCECGHDRNQHRVSLTGYRPCSICWNDLEDGIEKDICRDFKAAQQPEPSEVCETDFEDAEAIAKFFHYTYERLAPDFGYETRPDTKQFDAESPNGKLMIAVCGEFLAGIRKPATPPASEQSEVCGNCDQLAQTQAALKRLYHAEIKRRSVNDPLGMNAAMEEAGKWF